MSALVSFERVFEVLDLRAADRRPARRPRRCPTARSSVEFDDVRFAYPSADKVSLASLEEVATLDTRGGARCCTASRSASSPGRWSPWSARPAPASRRSRSSLPRLYDVDPAPCGSAASTSATCPPTSIRATVGMVTQDGHLFHDIDPRRTCCSPGPDADRRRAVGRAAAAPASTDLVASLPDGLDTVVGERGYRLSGGERQRLTIARLLLAQPRVVILDEATAHLDSTSEARAGGTRSCTARSSTSRTVRRRPPTWLGDLR